MKEESDLRINKDYSFLKKEVDKSFSEKTKEQEEFIKNSWKDFNEIKKKLESIVGCEFNKTIKKIELNGAKIIDFDVEYKPKSKEFGIKINLLQIPNKSFYLESIFSSIFDDKLAPEIRKFKEEYNVNYIGCDVGAIELMNEKKNYIRNL